MKELKINKSFFKLKKHKKVIFIKVFLKMKELKINKSFFKLTMLKNH